MTSQAWGGMPLQGASRGLTVFSPLTGTNKFAWWCGHCRAALGLEPAGGSDGGRAGRPFPCARGAQRQRARRAGRKRRSRVASPCRFPRPPGRRRYWPVLCLYLRIEGGHLRGGRPGGGESGGSGACSLHADLTKARHPKFRRPPEPLVLSLPLQTSRGEGGRD